MSTDTKLDAILAAARRERAAQFDWAIEEVMSLCESPIEKLFAAAILDLQWSMVHSLDEYRRATEPLGATFAGDGWWHELVLLGFDQAGPPVARLQQPVTIGAKNYRVDFAFVGVSGRVVAVELDGHDFHERTKEQAGRDKSRDRDFTRAGWFVLRFTGSEVYADPRACLREALAVVHDRKADR